MKTISEMSAQEVARWLNENATQQPEDIERLTRLLEANGP